MVTNDTLVYFVSFQQKVNLVKLNSLGGAVWVVYFLISKGKSQYYGFSDSAAVFKK